MSDSSDYDLMRYAQDHGRQRGCYVGESWSDFRGAPLIRQSEITDDDTAIWMFLIERGKWPFWLPSQCMAADRRDADLMLYARRYLLGHGARQYILVLGGIYCAGALEACDVLGDLQGIVW